MRVLIVDDEKMIADSLVSILSHHGFEAWRSYSGEDALKIAPLLAPDILLIDIVMGGMSGVTAAIEIRKMLPACRVMLFSEHASMGDALNRADADGRKFELLKKPLHPSDLIARLNELRLP